MDPAGAYCDKHFIISNLSNRPRLQTVWRDDCSVCLRSQQDKNSEETKMAKSAKKLGGKKLEKKAPLTTLGNKKG